jgi:hypothetical protein
MVGAREFLRADTAMHEQRFVKFTLVIKASPLGSILPRYLISYSSCRGAARVSG